MSVALDSSLHHDIHEDPTSESVADFLLEGAEHSPNAAGSFQVPDSDNDESLEELAGQQEQEYWSILGVDDPLLPVQLISPHASVKEVRLLLLLLACLFLMLMIMCSSCCM